MWRSRGRRVDVRWVVVSFRVLLRVARKVVVAEWKWVVGMVDRRRWRGKMSWG